MDDFVRTGGCFCGAVRYRFTAPALETHHCHCSMCRKVHGALMVTFSVISRDHFSIDQGADSLATFDSSPLVHRHFCRTCGCQIYVEIDDDPDILGMAPGTRDDGAHPGHPDDSVVHIYVGSKVPWYDITDGRPQREGS